MKLSDPSSFARTLRVLSLVLAATIVGGDLVQIPLIGKGFGAFGGACLYSVVVVSVWRRHPVGWWMALAIPILPTSILLGVLGRSVQLAVVDRGMLMIYGVQLALALVSVVALRHRSARKTNDLS